MQIEDLFENNIIPFPSRQIKNDDLPASRSDINYDVIDKLKQLNKESIERQRFLALPTIMSGQPKGIKPVAAWAYVLTEISKIKDKNKIQQWIFDKGREFINELIKLNQQDLNNYKLLDQVPIKFWEVGKTRAIIYKHKQIDRHAEDALQEFKKEYVDNVAEDTSTVTITKATKNGKIDQRLANKITDPHGYFNTNEGEVIPFPKKPSKIARLSTQAQDLFSKQKDIEDKVKDELSRVLKKSIARQRNLALPTVMTGFAKGIKPTQAWALSLGEMEFQNYKNLSTQQEWIYNKAKELINKLIAETKKDIVEYEDIYTIADEAPAPQYPRQSIAYSYREDRDALHTFEDLKKSI